LKALQTKTGCFVSTIDGTEEDLRFLYCACVVSKLIDDFSGINIDNAVQHILNCQSYDTSFSHEPGLEGHGIIFI
jgi:geranylgeranyl transferase type-1 subunit beta